MNVYGEVVIVARTLNAMVEIPVSPLLLNVYLCLEFPFVDKYFADTN